MGDKEKGKVGEGGRVRKGGRRKKGLVECGQ